jgi:hypothetical protein
MPLSGGYPSSTTKAFFFIIPSKTGSPIKRAHLCGETVTELLPFHLGRRGFEKMA